MTDQDDTRSDAETLAEVTRYFATSESDGSVVIYDETNAEAWIRSSGAVGIDAMS